MPSRCVAALLALMALAVGIAGCGPKVRQRYELSGAVSYRGQPLARGYVIFKPDTKRGNSGPAAQADIKDGRYRIPAAWGTVGGPHVAVLTGFDNKPYQAGAVENPNGATLFLNYQLDVDLPAQDSALDVAVPAAASSASRDKR